MKTGIKLLIAAVISLSVGIAFASPLLVSDLNIKPWIKHVQGPTSEFDVNVMYANFTVQNADTAIDQNNGPTIAYYVVVNVTNPSDLGAKLLKIDFVAAQKITNSSGLPFSANGSQGGLGWIAEGAWVDGKWYNVTWTDNFYPNFDKDGNMVPLPFNMSNYPSHWIAGAQIYDRYVNGTLTSTYLNMNGTWTDVTGRITVTRTTQGSSYSITSAVVNEMDTFDSTAVSNNTSNSTWTDSTIGPTKMTHHLVGTGQFDNYWAPNQSRLIVLSGTWDVHKPFGDAKSIDALKSGKLTLKTQTTNIMNETLEIENNTAVDTWSYATELKQVQLTQNGNSYIYNNALSNQVFQTDPWGVEVFVKPGS